MQIIQIKTALNPRRHLAYRANCSLYSSEDSFVKWAPGLSYKALFPSSVERQNVKLVIKIFNEKL